MTLITALFQGRSAGPNQLLTVTAEFAGLTEQNQLTTDI
jgi:hypothetical protein